MGLGERMKRYEQAAQNTLPERLPVILRFDGRNFHSFCSDLEEPFDERLIESMAEAAKAIARDVAGAQFVYQQSDELSLLVTPYTSLNFEPHFGNRVQKLVSTGASRITCAFNSAWAELGPGDERAEFDARCFVLPEPDVENYFIWRQLDWERNSLQMTARAHFSHEACEGLDSGELHEKLFQEADLNWAKLPTHHKNGLGIHKGGDGWEADYELPEFKDNRDYIRQFLPRKED